MQKTDNREDQDIISERLCIILEEYLPGGAMNRKQFSTQAAAVVTAMILTAVNIMGYVTQGLSKDKKTKLCNKFISDLKEGLQKFVIEDDGL